MHRYFHLSLFVLALVFVQVKPIDFNEASQPAQRINVAGMENLYKVSDELFRSEQPDNSDMKVVDSLGIKTILNLRQFPNDRKETNGYSFKRIDLHVNAWTMTYAEMVEALRLIKMAEKPVLVHCKHGSDRTGVVVAGYRIVFEKMSKEEAIAEFTTEKFGYHATLFPKLLQLLEKLDEDQLRKDVMNSNGE